jgi:hypothetical protein
MCKQAGFNQLKKEAEPRVKEIVEFFLGKNTYHSFKKEVKKLWREREEHVENHPWFRPWYMTAAEHHFKGRVFESTDTNSMPTISTRSFNIKLKECSSCGKKNQPVTYRLGAAMKVVLGLITRDEWNTYIVSKAPNKHEISHLNGISDDINPLN